MPIRLFLRPRDNRRVSARLRVAVLTRDKAICRYCGRAGQEIDHMIPFSWGGPCAMWNLYTACRNCNASKGAGWWLPLPRWVVWPVYLIRRWWWLALILVIMYLIFGG